MTSVNVIKHPESERKNSYLAVFKELENRVEVMWHNLFSREEKSEPLTMNVFEGMPRLDMVDRKKEVMVKAEFPGFTKKDIDVSIRGNQLVIKANACREEKVEKGEYLTQEISRSEVYRTLVLPADVESEKMKTSFKNGVLKLRIPKMK